jgi:hypothetical protein
MNPALIQQFYRMREALLLEYPDLQDDHPALLDTIDGMDGLQDAMRWMIRAARGREADASACKQYAKELTDRASRLTAGADRLRDSVKQVMSETGIKKLAAPDFTATLAPGRESVVITDETLLPDNFVRIKREPDKTAIRIALLDEGGEVPGACLSNTTPTLTVRTS